MSFRTIRLDSGEDLHIPNLEEEELLISRIQNKINFWNSDEMWIVYIGLFSFFGTLILSLFDLNIPSMQIWGNSTKILLEIDIIGYPLLVLVTLIINNLQQIIIRKRQMAIMYLIIFGLIIIADLIGNYEPIKQTGFGTSFWCVLFGLLFRYLVQITKRFHYVTISNLQKTIIPYEATIRIAIIIYAIDLSQVLYLVLNGLVIAWVETFAMIVIITILGYKLINFNTGLVVAFGISICGPFAASKIADIISYDLYSLKTFLSIMSISTIPSLLSIPMIANGTNLTSQSEGTWIGGSVDGIGVVIASSSLGGEQVVESAIIIKLLQMIFLVPLCLAVNHFMKYGKSNFYVLQSTFPIFIIAFLLSSTILSLLPEPYKEKVSNNCFVLSQWFSNSAFVLIGFDINLKILFKIKQEWRVFLLYIIGQILDIVSIFILAYFLF